MHNLQCNEHRFRPMSDQFSSRIISSNGRPALKALMVPGSLNFGDVIVGTESAKQVVTLLNEGYLPLQISAIRWVGDFHVITDAPANGELPVNGYCSFTVTYRPTADGNSSGALYVDTLNTEGNTFITLQGRGVDNMSGPGGGGGSFIPWVYNGGSANGGELTLTVTENTVGVPELFLNGLHQEVGLGFTFDPDTAVITLADQLEEGDEVIAHLSGVPANPDNPNIDNWHIVNWLYNEGSAIGGEQVLVIPYTFQTIVAVFKNGLRYVANLLDKSFSFSTSAQSVTLTEALVPGDRVVVQIGGELSVIEMSDRTLYEVARGANSTNDQVIISSATGDSLTGKTIIYDNVAQHYWSIPAGIPAGSTYVSVSGTILTYSDGGVTATINLIPVPDSGTTLRADLLSNDPAKGDALVAQQQPFSGSVLRTLHSKAQDILYVEDFGAVSNGGNSDAHINSLSFQNALTANYARGGGKVTCKGGVYVLDYPIYLRDNTDLDLNGATIIFLNPVFNIGRGGIVIGQSVEANRDTALAAYAAGTYPGATTNNPSFVNPAIKQYLRDNPSFIQARNCRVHGGKIVAQHPNGGRGGYGINFVNAIDSFAYDIIGDGWTQLIGMGSDGTPETPSNHNCHAYDLVVINGDPILTYYSIGFVSNSTACSISRAKQINPLTVGTANGSAIATNYVEDCYFDDINIIDLGRTASSEGLLLNNAKGCRASRISVGNAISAVSTYYTDASFNDITRPNHISDVYAVNCNYALSLRAKFAIIDNVAAMNVTGDVFWANNNASDNVLNFTPQKMVFGGSNFPATFLTLNTVKGWKYQYAYLRPADMLINDRTDLAVVSSAKVIGSKAGVNLALSYQLPPYMRAVNDIRMFLTFNTGSLTAASAMSISLRRMLAFDGNLGEVPYVEMTNSRTSVSDTLQDTSLVAQASGSTPGYVLAADTTHGLANAWELYITATNNVLNNYVKEARIGFWGD